MALEQSPEQEQSDTSTEKLSNIKNPYGVEMRKARPIGVLFSILTGIAFFLAIVRPMSSIFIKIPLLWLTFFLFGTSIKFTMSESESGKFKNLFQEAGGDLEKHQSDQSIGPTKSVCRECRQEISPDAKRCPSCGWKPKKRGGLWWGTTALMSFNPIGWVMGAKGASDNLKASRGVSEETTISSETINSESENVTPESPIDKIERLCDLKEEGVISEEEFEAKKTELLKDV